MRSVHRHQSLDLPRSSFVVSSSCCVFWVELRYTEGRIRELPDGGGMAVNEPSASCSSSSAVASEEPPANSHSASPSRRATGSSAPRPGARISATPHPRPRRAVGGAGGAGPRRGVRQATPHAEVRKCLPQNETTCYHLRPSGACSVFDTAGPWSTLGATPVGPAVQRSCQVSRVRLVSRRRNA